MDFHTRAHSNHRRRPNETDMALQHVLTATAAVTAVIDNEQRLFTTVAVQFASLVNARYGALGILSENGTLRDSFTHGLAHDDETFLRPTPPIGNGILGALLT
jgi:hypothetical protein